IFPLHHSQSTAILFGSIALLFVGFCYLSGQLGVLPKTVRSYDGTISRVIKSSQYEKEYIIRGSESEKLQKVLATQWPFEGHSFESQWIAVDSKGNNVTNSKLGLSEGTVEIIFQPR
ncbi:MAG: hypothetical protein EAX95_16570, partial [Candidatus Thorarchaeota archaeon]|nr:hypothetical protein [Candidatus Thorarchaeota archaeon]